MGCSFLQHRGGDAQWHGVRTINGQPFEKVGTTTSVGCPMIAPATSCQVSTRFTAYEEPSWTSPVLPVKIIHLPGVGKHWQEEGTDYINGRVLTASMHSMRFHHYAVIQNRNFILTFACMYVSNVAMYPVKLQCLENAPECCAADVGWGTFRSQCAFPLNAPP